MAAIMVAAVFAGVVLMDDEASAEKTEVTQVSYVIGDNTLTYPVNEDSTFVVKDISEFDVEYAGTFDGWLGEGSVVYTAGQTVKVSSMTAEDGKLVLTAQFEGQDQVTYIVEGKPYAQEFIDPATSGAPAIPSEAQDAIDALKDKKLVGWIYSADGKTYTPGKLPETVKHGETLTAVFQDIYEVYWSIDGTVTASGNVSEMNAPQAPTKDNYTFIGWKVGDKLVITYNSGLVTDSPKDFEDFGYRFVDKDYKFTADTTFVAYFEPVQLTVTLITGDETETQIAAYGEVYRMPALDSGYVYWATKVVKEVTGEDGTVTTVEEYVEFDFTKALTEDITLYAIPEEDVPDESIYATFNIEGTIYGPYKVTDRFSIPQTDREGYNFLGWTIQGGDGTRLTSEQVQNYQYTEDVTFVAIYEVAEPPAPEEPAFYETTTGQVAIIIVVFALLLFGYAVYSNMGGLKDKLFGYTISKKEKKE